MTILPSNIRIFPFFLVISLTDKPVGRSIHVSALRQLSVFPLRGFIFNDIHKNKKGVRTIRATKYEKYMAGKFTRAVHLWRESTQIEYSIEHNKYEIINQIESQNSGLNYLLIKSNRTALQTFGHPVVYTLKGSDALLFQHLFVTCKHTNFLLASERRRIFSRRFSPFIN